MIKHDPTKSMPYIVRIIGSIIALLAGIVFLASSIQYRLQIEQIPQSIHEMSEDELVGAYVTISKLYVIRDTEDGYYVDVPIANGEILDMAFWSDEETIIDEISILQGIKNIQNLKENNWTDSSDGDYFISVDYTGTIFQGKSLKILQHGGVDTFLGMIDKEESDTFLAVGGALSILGIFGLISTIIIMRRKPKIIKCSDLQSIHSEYELTSILSGQPVYKNIWLSQKAILIMMNNKVTQINFHDMTSIEVIETTIQYMKIYTVKIVDRFQKQHVQAFEGKDEAVQFIQYLSKLAPQAILSDTIPQASNSNEQISHESHINNFTKTMEDAQHTGNKKRKQSLKYFMLTFVLGFFGLAIFGFIAWSMPPMIRQMMLGNGVDAIVMLETIAYPIIIPIVLLMLLSIILIILAVQCINKTGDFKVAASMLALMLGSGVILLPPLMILENVSIDNVLGAFEDIKQIETGALIESEVYISNAATVDAEMLMYLIDDVGYDVTVLSCVPTDIDYYNARTYYFPTVVPTNDYEQSGYEVQAEYEENRANAKKYRITHTENWRIIIDIEEIA